MGSHPNQKGNPHSHSPDPNNGPPPAINYTARPNNAPANNQHPANLAIQSAPPANYYHQQPATDHGTHPNHQSLQQHYSGAPPADQSARGHNNGAPWPNVYVSHNNYGAAPANGSASDPNYGAPATDHGTHPNHQSLQQHYSGAPPADQSARGHNNGAPWPNVYVSHNNYGSAPANGSALDPNYGAPATDHGTHPNHQSLQQHYSGAPPADQLARGHNNGAPWPNVYVSHNNYGAPPANESALDPNYGAPPAHQSAQGHTYGAPQANQYVPQPPTNNYAPWPNEYVEHHNHSTQETSYVRLQQGAHRGYPQISKQPTIAQDVSPLGVDSLPGHGFFEQLQTSSHQPQINAQPDMLPDLTDLVHPTSEFNELGSRFSAYSPPDYLDNKKATTPWLPSNVQNPLASDVHMDVGLDQLGVRKDVGSDIHTGASSMSQDPPMPGPSSTVPLPPVVRPTGMAPEDVVLTLQELRCLTTLLVLHWMNHLKKFNNVDELKKFAQTWGQAHAYRLPVSKSKAGKNIYMDCSLSGEDPRPAGVERIRESKNRRCNCPSVGSKLPHNHGPIDIQYEVVHKGLPPDAQDESWTAVLVGTQPAAIHGG
ncbi:hypothetical protein PSHT_12896 [Puccinia striiformis]|uniref:Uncharacterized protein n=1 Tax=Puccinia striiformis TaxID=27350 RepID=A0A2S4UU73_9BASI|nr:hypothetical protein PSHT_12896 [Puccinia striiformis]